MVRLKCLIYTNITLITDTHTLFTVLLLSHYCLTSLINVQSPQYCLIHLFNFSLSFIPFFDVSFPLVLSRSYYYCLIPTIQYYSPYYCLIPYLFPLLLSYFPYCCLIPLQNTNTHGAFENMFVPGLLAAIFHHAQSDAQGAPRVETKREVVSFSGGLVKQAIPTQHNATPGLAHVSKAVLGILQQKAHSS